MESLDSGDPHEVADLVLPTLLAQLRRPAVHDPILEESECLLAVARAYSIAGSCSQRPADRVFRPRTHGEYQLIGELGKGGMGTVYKALHTKLNRVVALKVLSRSRMGDRQAIHRFEREMKAVGRLVHSNIVQAYDAREIDGTPVLIMECVDGLDLAKLVRRINRLPAADACERTRQAARAQQCADEHGLVHRDIKPSNIMLARSGEVKLLDLGLASCFADDCPDASTGDDMTGTGLAMGTADYLAPGQASDNHAVDIRAEICSLGGTFYKLLTRRSPFDGPEYRAALDKMNAHVQLLPPSALQSAPETPEQVTAVLDRILAKEPADRFATPAEITAALAPWCAGTDLPALLERAESADPTVAPEEGREGGVSSAGQVESAPRPQMLASRGKKWFVGQLLLLGLVGGLGLALGIIIRVHKDGQPTKVDVPPGSTTRVGSDGQVDIELSHRAGAASFGCKTRIWPRFAIRVATDTTRCFLCRSSVHCPATMISPITPRWMP
jgi:serine/threonine protein kinase